MTSESATKPIYGIFRRIRSVNQDRGVRRLIKEYVDQASKSNAIDPEAAQKVFDPVSYEHMHRSKLLPQRPGIEFVPSLQTTTVRIEGFLKEVVGGERVNRAENVGEGLATLAEWWCRQTEDLSANKGTHLVFSISPELQRTLLEAKLPAQDILMAASMNSLSRYNTWASPHAALGYILGYHTDKPNSHLHALVFPRNSRGDRLNFSSWANTNYHGKMLRLDYRGYVASAYSEFLEATHRRVGPEAHVALPFGKFGAVGALISLNDFQSAVPLAEQSGRPILDCLQEAAKANAPLYRDTVFVRGIQEKCRERFVAEGAEFKRDPSATLLDMSDSADQVRKLALKAGEAAAIARQAAQLLGTAHSKYTQSPYAYRLTRLPGGIVLPATLTDEWSRSVPEPSITSGNHFFYAVGMDAVTQKRRNEARNFMDCATNALKSMEPSRTTCHALPSAVGYYAAKFEEMRAALTARSPFHLKTDVDGDSVVPALTMEDRGFESLRMLCVAEADRTLAQHAPFDPLVDNRRDFWDVGDSSAREDEEDPVPQITVDSNGVPRPLGVSDFEPDQMNTSLEAALARLLKINESFEHGPAIEDRASPL